MVQHFPAPSPDDPNAHMMAARPMRLRHADHLQNVTPAGVAIFESAIEETEERSPGVRYVVLTLRTVFGALRFAMHPFAARQLGDSVAIMFANLSRPRPSVSGKKQRFSIVPSVDIGPAIAKDEGFCIVENPDDLPALRGTDYAAHEDLVSAMSAFRSAESPKEIVTTAIKYSDEVPDTEASDVKVAVFVLFTAIGGSPTIEVQLSHESFERMTESLRSRRTNLVPREPLVDEKDDEVAR